jgi:hypothetical protein
MRYRIVSDGDEYTVWDSEANSDLFPTRTGNRRYACRFGCSKQMAKRIADALNLVPALRAEIALLERKIAHGCSDAACQLCESKED